MTLLNQLLFRVGHAIRIHPWIRMLLGALLIIAGALELFLGIGHGGVVLFGVLLVAGGATAARARHGRAPSHEEVDTNTEDQQR